MPYNLFIDDERFPPNDGREWQVARSYTDVLIIISQTQELPTYISFDHDLGDKEPTGHDIAKFLIELDLSDEMKIPDGFSFYVHSQNPIGKANIEGVLNSYLRHIGRT